MEMTLSQVNTMTITISLDNFSQTITLQCYNPDEETAKALNYQNIRLLRVSNDFSLDSEYQEITTFAHGWSAPTAG